MSHEKHREGGEGRGGALFLLMSTQPPQDSWASTVGRSTALPSLSAEPTCPVSLHSQPSMKTTTAIYGILKPDSMGIRELEGLAKERPGQRGGMAMQKARSRAVSRPAPARQGPGPSVDLR